MDRFRIQEIQAVTLNGRRRVLFKAYEYSDRAHVFCGQFSAPANTPNHALEQYIH